MNAAFNETLVSWSTFYFTMAGASAGLIGLMFVALSLGLQIVENAPTEEGHAFATPSVIYFVTVLVIAAIMLIPAIDSVILGLLLLLTAFMACFNMFSRWRKLLEAAVRHGDFFVSDWMAQIIAPILSYMLVIAAALCFIVSQGPLAFGALWLACVVLMLSAIANTWAMVAWIIDYRTGKTPE